MGGNNLIRITYDPYQKRIECKYRNAGTHEWELPAAEGKLATIFRQGSLDGTLQNYAHDIVDGIKVDFCTSGQGVDLLFCGTDEDWEDMKAAVQERGLEKEISCTGTTGQLPCAKDLLPKINEIFQNLSLEFNGQLDSDVERPLNQYLETVNPDVVLYVAGVYSAGKSTFINALIGEELLPSAVDPTTAHVFKIVSKPEGNWQDTEIYFRYLGQETALKFRDSGYVLENLNRLPDQKLKNYLDTSLSGANTGPAYVRKALTELNGFNAMMNPKEETGEQETEGKKESYIEYISTQIEVRTPFYHSSLPLEQFRVLVFDTPGTNSENNQEHRKVMEESLKNQTNGLPILLVRPDDMDARHVMELKKSIHEIGKSLDESNILIVVSKADKEQYRTLKKQSEGKAALVARKGTEKRICYISAAMGLYAKMGRCPLLDEEELDAEELDDIAEDLNSKKKRYTEGSAKLYEIDSLPQNRLKQIQQAGHQANAAGPESERLFHNSGLWAVEREIAWFARRFAGYNKCWQAQGYLSDAIEAVKKSQEDEHQRLVDLKAKSKEDFDTEKTSLIEAIEGKCRTWEKDKISQCQKRHKEKIDAVNSKQKELAKKVAEQWKQEKESHKGGFGLNALDPFKKWAEQEVRKYVESGSEEIEAYATDFLTTAVDELKKDCIEIIMGSEELPEREKKLMESCILETQAPEFKKVSFTLNSKAAGNRNFLFIKWATVQKDNCASEMIDSIVKELHRFNRTYLNDLQGKIKDWLNDFQNRLKQKLVSLNSTLADLDREIQECERQINALEQAHGRLEDAQKKLDSYFTFSEDGGAK